MAGTVDTCLLIDLQNGVPGARGIIESVMIESGGLILTAPVFAEILTGVERAETKPSQADIEHFVESAIVIPFDAKAARVYAGEVARLLGEGTAPKVMDAQIAACAIASNLELVTRDARGFPRFQGLRLRLVHL